MDIIFQGSHNSEEAAGELTNILRLFAERYRIGQFREMHLSVTLVDLDGFDVELVDSKTSEVYRVVEVVNNNQQLLSQRKRYPVLQLVVDNTR